MGTAQPPRPSHSTAGGCDLRTSLSEQSIVAAVYATAQMGQAKTQAGHTSLESGEAMAGAFCVLRRCSREMQQMSAARDEQAAAI